MMKVMMLSVLFFSLIGNAQVPNAESSMGCYVLAMGKDSKGEFASSRITEEKKAELKEGILTFKDTLEFSAEKAVLVLVKLNTKSAQLSAGMSDISTDERRGEGSDFIGWADLSRLNTLSFSFSTNMPITEGYFEDRASKDLVTVTKLNLSCVYKVVGTN